MNRDDASYIADTVTREQLSVMFDRAKVGVKDWRQVSDVNPHFTKGHSWNLLYPAFKAGRRLPQPAIKNMVWEFGDFLDDELKPETRRRQHREAITPVHQDPVW